MQSHPPLTFLPAPPSGIIPTDDQCQAWWEACGMLEHIKHHSLLVADIATTLAQLAVATGRSVFADLSPEEGIALVRAAAMLHDLGKTYCIAHGGNHSQVGAAWAMERTGNPRLAQGVLHHVYWPGPLDAEHFFLPLAVSYSDKRVRHAEIVSLSERFDDLMARYGRTKVSRNHIRRTYAQAQTLEAQLTTYLGVPLHEYPFDCRRLVRGT